MTTNMDSKTKSSLFEVYLRLRPPPAGQPTSERFLTVEETSEDAAPTHITLNPPNDNRRRAIEKFAFTEVFEEESTQLDLFQGTGVLPLVEGVLGPQGGEGRDALLATLGVTGSGKSHTILGSRTQRGMTQLALDVLFRSISNNILDPATTTSLHATVAASDPSEAQVMSAQMFLDTMYNDTSAASRASSRAPTPMVVRVPTFSEEPLHASSKNLYPSLQGIDSPNINTQTGSPKSIRVVTGSESVSSRIQTRSQARKYQSSNIESQSVMGPSFIPSYMQSTLAKAVKYVTKSPFKGESSYIPPTPRRNLLQKPSVLPQNPDISNLTVNADQSAEYAILISMYEVYNDRIFDLLTPAIPGKSAKDFRRRPLLFKSTEQSPDRKVVAGLRKIICGSMKEALMVLEAGLHERRVAGTGSNSVSSRSHGFFCVEVKKRRRGRLVHQWGGSALTIVDLAGSERARDAKTQGATLVEAGKINESLMYLGQCLQMQSDLTSSAKPNLVPFRQCKLTELLFSNSFPSHTTIPSTPSHSFLTHTSHHYPAPIRNAQKAVMIVTADPLGDFNATSQILRYSALAREITVPRIPSITSTILAQSTASHYFSPRSPPGSSCDQHLDRSTMEIAALEIARMSEEIDGLREELANANEARMEQEAHMESLQEKVLEMEMQVREECVAEMEAQFQTEIARWKATWQAEQDRNDEHLDRKLEIYTRSIDAADVDLSATTDTAPFHNLQDDKENSHSGPGKISNLQIENERLRREIEVLRREGALRSPSKRMPLRESKVGRDRSQTPDGNLDDVEDEEGLEERLERLSVSSHGLGVASSKADRSPTKKVRKLVTRKWDLLDEGEML
ncbi:related to rabkinesin-6 [Rhynchosporium agropyri]|uniref:Related to rabkinesin-6 n=1 Tax=Rhynchosporium agropyri TaxID=914238 RepID=A0A1E1JRR7_9HELO|nr:related to rabkinesin-6 [Rhynchosporium agropyri]